MRTSILEERDIGQECEPKGTHLIILNREVKDRWDGAGGGGKETHWQGLVTYIVWEREDGVTPLAVGMRGAGRGSTGTSRVGMTGCRWWAIAHRGEERGK